MIQVNTRAFQNLNNQLNEEANLSVTLGKTYFKTSLQEQSWLKETELIDTLQILPNLKAVFLLFDGNKFLCCIGTKFTSSGFDESVLDDFDLNAGIITLLIAEEILKINRNANFLEFYNDIMFQHKDIAYKGHDYQELMPFLEPIQLYILPQNSVLINENINRVFVYIFSNNPKSLILQFETNVTNTVSDLALIGSNKISYSLLISSLLSTNYKHAFLELYRLVERLFPINYLKEFHLVVNTKLSFLQFAAELENITSWRPKEDEALNKIFLSTKGSTLRYFRDFLNSSVALSTQNDSTCFYKLRNSIVHFRASHQEFDLNDHQWNLILLATLYLVDEHYTINSTYLL